MINCTLPPFGEVGFLTGYLNIASAESKFIMIGETVANTMEVFVNAINLRLLFFT